jgi:hypothetical protein
VVALILTRRRGEADEAPETAPVPRGGSFLDEAPQDTLAGLGKAEQPVEDVTVDPAVERQARRAAEAAPATSGSARQTPAATPQATPPQGTRGGLGLDWGPSGNDVGGFEPAAPLTPAAGAAAAGATVAAALHDDRETTGELPAAALSPEAPAPKDKGPAPAPKKPLPESGGHASPESARPAEGGSVAPEAAPKSDAGGRMVPLSSIIVTTSRKMVDVQDPEVRRMLTDLVKFEIDQATQFSRDGQTIDAVLQLTEAEKISRALGMDDAARHIHQMMQDIQAG